MQKQVWIEKHFKEEVHKYLFGEACSESSFKIGNWKSWGNPWKEWGYIPQGPSYFALGTYNQAFAPEKELFKRTWISLYKTFKRLNKIPVFLGRDTWILKVLAERFSLDHIFNPQVSRSTVSRLAYSLQFPENALIVDTGFAGSCTIPFSKPYLLLSANRREFQVSPSEENIRDLVLRVEDFPSYWRSAHFSYINGLIHQDLVDEPQIIQAATFTSLFWRMFSLEEVLRIKR